MSDATFTVSFAGPLVTVQDAGRPGHMRYGVSASGPMDRLAFDAAHAALGNPSGATGIEVSLGGLVLTCTSGAVSLAVTGGNFVVEHRGRKQSAWCVVTVEKGDRITIRGGKSGSWAYVALAGTLNAEHWLESTATHAVSGFGGGPLQAGQTLRITGAAVHEERTGDIARPEFVPTGPLRVVTGPQDQHFTDDALERFLTEKFAVTDAYDRMGMRLRGPELPLVGALSIPSEPIVRGSVQVSGDGVPTVLLADHQTTGGYPKIAMVIAPDIDRLVQLRSGDGVRFAAISAAEAVGAARDYAVCKAEYLEQIAVPRGTLGQRLMRENLIHACVLD